MQESPSNSLGSIHLYLPQRVVKGDLSHESPYEIFQDSRKFLKVFTFHIKSMLDGINHVP